MNTTSTDPDVVVIGGGVMGACGYNAAREIVRDARRGR